MWLNYRLPKYDSLRRHMYINIRESEVITFREDSSDSKNRTIAAVDYITKSVFILVFCNPEFTVDKELIKSDFKSIMQNDILNVHDFRITVLSLTQLLDVNNIEYESVLRVYAYQNKSLRSKSTSIIFDAQLSNSNYTYCTYKIDVSELMLNQLQTLTKFNKYLKDIRTFDYSLIDKIASFIDYNNASNSIIQHHVDEYYVYRKRVGSNDILRAMTMIKVMDTRHINNSDYLITNIQAMTQFVIDTLYNSKKSHNPPNEFGFVLNGCQLNIKISANKYVEIALNIPILRDTIKTPTPYGMEFTNFLKLLSNDDRDIVLSKFEIYKLKNS